MKTRPALLASVGAMALLVALAVAFPHGFEAFLRRPELYLHAKLAHVLAATLFFGNVVIGTIWETRSLVSKRAEIIRYTYATVAWLDAVFTAPLILVALVSGLMLGTLAGGVFSIGWLVVAFAIFALSGLVWLALDIPTQYRVKRLMDDVPLDAKELPEAVLRLLRFRVVLNVGAIALLLVVLTLMVHKPDLPSVQRWLQH
jgi:uncharacterized membrane protein